MQKNGQKQDQILALLQGQAGEQSITIRHQVNDSVANIQQVINLSSEESVSPSSKSTNKLDMTKFADINFNHLEFDENITNLIGNGSYGDVFRCKYKGKPAALKKLRLGNFSSYVMDSIRREAAIMSLTRDRNIIGFEGCDLTKNMVITELGHCNLTEMFYNPKRPLSV
jgi:hypothetical protein